MAFCAPRFSTTQFKGGFGVIIKATHQPGLYPVGQVVEVEIAQELPEMFPAILTEKIVNQRESLGGRLTAFKFAIKDPQGIDLCFPLAIGAELILHLGGCFPQRLPVGWPAPWAANRIDQGRHSFDLNCLQKAMGHLYNFGVNSGSGSPNTSTSIWWSFGGSVLSEAGHSETLDRYNKNGEAGAEGPTGAQ